MDTALPFESILSIFQYTSARDLLRAMEVSKTLHKLIKDNFNKFVYELPPKDLNSCDILNRLYYKNLSFFKLSQDERLL